MYLLNILLIAQVFLAVLATSNGKNPFIIGGEFIDIKSAPWQISIQTFRKHSCGGAIISKSWAVATALCLQTRAPGWAITIRAGSTRVLPVIEWEGTTHGIEKKIVHPSYDASIFDYDIGVIQVSNVFAESEKIKPVSLPPIGVTEDRFLDYSEKAVVTGWGIGQVGGLFQTWTLKRVGIPIVPRIKCLENLESLGVKVTSRMICVFGKEIGPCSGDEGGPLLQKNVLIGLFSWNARKCADPELPSRFTNLFDEEIRSFVKTLTNV